MKNLEMVPNENFERIFIQMWKQNNKPYTLAFHKYRHLKKKGVLSCLVSCQAVCMCVCKQKSWNKLERGWATLKIWYKEGKINYRAWLSRDRDRVFSWSLFKKLYRIDLETGKEMLRMCCLKAGMRGWVRVI